MHRATRAIGGWGLVVVILMVVLATIAPAQQKKRRGFQIGVKVKLVTLDVTVLDRSGQLVEGLTRDDFVVLEDGKAQDITLFQQADLPISLGLVIDTSGSMRNKLNFVNESILSFLKNSNPENQVFVVDFSHDKAELLQDFTQDPDDVRDAIREKMLAGGGTPLWDSVYLALQYLDKAKFERKAILVVSDGEDKDSYYQFEDVMKMARQKDAQIYFIALQDPGGRDLFDLGSFSREEATRQMKEIAQFSGGWSFYPEDLRDLEGITRTIAEELRRQYRIGYKPANEPKGEEFRKLEVVLKKEGDYQIRARKGYFTSMSLSQEKTGG